MASNYHRYMDRLERQMKEVEREMDICGCHGVRRKDCSYYQRAKFGYSYSDIGEGLYFTSSHQRRKTYDGVELTIDGTKCKCHFEDIGNCPTLLKKNLDKTKKEHSETKLQLRKATQELENRPVVTVTKEVQIPGPERVITRYRDKVEDVENDPNYNIRKQELFLEEAEMRRVRANILSVLCVLGIAGVTPLALLIGYFVFIPVGVLAVILGIVNGGRMPTWQITESKQEKLKWEARQNLALQSQMQTFLSEPTIGSTLPTMSGTAPRELTN